MLRLLNTRYNYLKQSKFALPPSVHGFKHISSNPHPDSNVYVHHLVHQKTNAHFYHLQNDDANNCFAPVIKTIIDNNKGTPHILEHLVCCGSKNYPIRDPFMNMLKRSLNTYMNAWTGEDFTAYPFSSANSKDFSNLLKVYSDMVFKANLDYYDFRQEGWRYEIGQNGAQYKGIVLNQMKGVYQSPQRQLWLQVNKNLLKGTPYEFDTGGEPKQIVNLEYNQLKSLFSKFYHPSNMSFYSYGNRDFRQTLDYLNQKYLNSFQKNSQQPQIKSPVEPVHQSTIYTKDQTNQIILAYYLGRLDDVSSKDLMALGLISYLLFESNQAPMYEQLIESGIGQVFTDIYGLRADKLVTFGVGLKGVQFQHSKYKQKIQSIFNKIIQQGFPVHLVQQALVQTEISSIYPSKNKGIKMLQKLLGVINHRGDIARILNYKQELKQAKIDIQNKEYRHYLVQKYFIKNNHYTIVLQQPNDDIKQSNLIPPANLPTDTIKQQQNTLLKRQLEPMNKSILPTLQLTDINKYPPKEDIYSNESSLAIVQSPSGLSYTKVIFTPNQKIPQNINKLIDIWLYVINKGISTHKYNYKQLNKQVSLCSNGINATHGLRVLTKSPFIQFSISSLDSTTQKGSQLLGHFIKNMKFDDGQNLKTLLIRYQNEFKNDIIQSPMDYAISIATSLIQNIQNNEGKLIQGLQSYNFAEQYIHGKRNDSQLVQVTKIVNKLPYKIIVHTGDTKNIPTKIVDNFIKSFEKNCDDNKKQYVGQKKQRKEFKSLSFTQQNYDVNYCVASFYGPEMMTKEAAELSIFLELLEANYLHKKIREQGGAYGSGAKLQNGAIFFYSYADPQCQNTFKVFSESIQQILNSEQISLEDLKQSKLSIFARIDVEPVDYQKGMNSILHGVSRDYLQKYRQYVINSDLKNVLHTGSKYLKNKQCHRIVFGKDIPSGFKQININFDNHYELIQTVRKEIN